MQEISLRNWLQSDRDLVRVRLACNGKPDGLAVVDLGKYRAQVCPVLQCLPCNDCSGFRAAVGWCHLRKLLGPGVAAGYTFLYQ